jgi:hypothetical protein
MTNETAAPEAKSDLPGVNVLLMGPSGTGKTYSIGTLVDAGLKVFYIALEPGLETLLGYYRDNGKPVPPNLHWKVIEAQKASFADFRESVKRISTMAMDTLAKSVDPARSKYNTFDKILEALNDFTDDRTGQSFGCADTWGPDSVLVVDGMSGLSRAAMGLVIGGKPVKSQADWGIAQDQIDKFLFMLTTQLKCHFILLAHVEREIDPVLGGTKIMLSTLGKALAPKLPAMFSDVILTVREGSKFTWDTASAQADVKTRNLGIAAGQAPSFAPILARWRKRSGMDGA